MNDGALTNLLEGRKVKSCNIGKDSITLFMEDGNDLIFEAVGDCCSQSWFEETSGEEALVDAVIYEAEFIDLNKEEWDGSDELIQFYGFKIKTSKGYFDADMRNSSNGYYGGDIEVRNANTKEKIYLWDYSEDNLERKR